jgi:hypothetical protein
VSEELLERFARRAGVPRGVVLRATREMADRVREMWPAFKRETELDARTLRAIDKHMATVPLLTGRKATALTGPADDAAPLSPQPEIG